MIPLIPISKFRLFTKRYQNFHVRNMRKMSSHDVTLYLSVYRKPGEEDQKGRTSGASAWRLARKEISETSEERKHVWIVNTDDILSDAITIKYSPSLNRYEYFSGDKKIKELLNWNDGAYEQKGIFRKEEKDWNMVYLARNG